MKLKEEARAQVGCGASEKRNNAGSYSAEDFVKSSSNNPTAKQRIY
jgi:hypothetical protein